MSLSVRGIAGDDWQVLRDVRLAALLDSPDAFYSTYEQTVDRDEADWRAWPTRGLAFVAWLRPKSSDVAGRGVVESGDVAGRGVLESGVVAGRGVLASGGVAERGIAGSGGIAGRGIAEPVGLVAIAESSDEPGMADLFSMWVAPAARGTGAADALIAAALDWARARELTGVLLEVAPGNARAQRVYTRHGFTVTEEPSMIIGGSTMRLRFPVVTSGTGPAPADVHRL